MRILTLAYWYELDRRAKKRFDELLARPIPGLPEKGGDWWLARKLTLGLAPPFLLAPVATKLLYSWLPQPDWWLYEAMGMMLLGVAFVAHTEYKKAQAAD